MGSGCLGDTQGSSNAQRREAARPRDWCLSTSTQPQDITRVRVRLSQDTRRTGTPPGGESGRAPSKGPMADAQNAT